ncbi:MAG: hypothetical protein RPR40_10225 [Bermanella sp.]
MSKKTNTTALMSGLVIGIDPDLDKSGVAIVKGENVIELHALTFPELLAFAQRYKDHATFILENVEYDKATYFRSGTNAAMMRKIAQNVGQVKGTARQLFNCLEHMGCNVIKVKPLTGPVKKRAKKDAKYFNKITGWAGGSNEDKRDAALLALNG